MAKKKKATRKPNEAYEMPTKAPPCDKYVIGLDPGSRNFGIAAVGLRKNKPFVAASAVFTSPINDLVNFNACKCAFLEEFARWVSLFNPVGFVGERFQTRGNLGPLVEQVSAMLGLIAGKYDPLPVKLTIASAWKNKVQRRFGIDLKLDVYQDSKAPAHQIDAALIGIFGLEAGTGVELDYTVDDIVQQVETTSLTRIKS